MSQSRIIRSCSAWVALGDTPVQHGCMTFIPGSHSLRNLPAQDLYSENSLMSINPEFIFPERVTGNGAGQN